MDSGTSAHEYLEWKNAVNSYFATQKPSVGKVSVDSMDLISELFAGLDREFSEILSHASMHDAAVILEMLVKEGLHPWMILNGLARDCPACQLDARKILKFQENQRWIFGLNEAPGTEVWQSHRLYGGLSCKGMPSPSLPVVLEPFLLGLGDLDHYNTDHMLRKVQEELLLKATLIRWKAATWIENILCQSLAVVLLRWQLTIYMLAVPEVQTEGTCDPLLIKNRGDRKRFYQDTVSNAFQKPDRDFVQSMVQNLSQCLFRIPRNPFPKFPSSSSSFSSSSSSSIHDPMESIIMSGTATARPNGNQSHKYPLFVPLKHALTNPLLVPRDQQIKLQRDGLNPPRLQVNRAFEQRHMEPQELHMDPIINPLLANPSNLQEATDSTGFNHINSFSAHQHPFSMMNGNTEMTDESHLNYLVEQFSEPQQN